jgi:predicted amidohydrolase
MLAVEILAARHILRAELSALAEGSCADVAVFALREGQFPFVDSGRAKCFGM